MSINLDKFLHFLIYTDSGSLIYKLSTENDIDSSMLGILQALFFTGEDLNCEINSISSDLGIVTFKSYKSNGNDNSVLLALILPHDYADQELVDTLSTRLLDYLHSILIMHIGSNDLYSHNSPSEIDSLKKLILTYEKSVKYILTNFQNLTLLLQSEKRLEINNDMLYPIKHYLEEYKSQIKVEFICLSIYNSIIWASQDWASLDIVDRILLGVTSNVYNESEISSIPVYLPKTKLENDGTGKTSFKLFNINLSNSNDAKILILSDSAMNVKKIYDSFNSQILDDFFLSRLLAFKHELKLGNLIDTTAKSLIIYNSESNSYKILLDETKQDVFSNFIRNVNFCSYFLNQDPTCDEFYAKDEGYTFYYNKIESLSFFTLYDKSTTFDDINTVKTTLRTYIYN